MSYRPPDSTGSTSSSLHHPLSHSPSGSWTETIEEPVIEEDAPLSWTSSEESEEESLEGDSLADADHQEIATRALDDLGLLPHQPTKDKPDIWASPAFNRPLLGTENDREVAKRMAPFFKDLTQYLDDTDWMYATPQTFRPYQPEASGSTNTSSAREAPSDLPVFQYPHEGQNRMQEAAELVTRMRNMRVYPQGGPADPPGRATSSAAAATSQSGPDVQAQQRAFASFADSLGQAEAELEMSFANDSFPGNARNAHLIREVSMLGM